MWSGQALPWGPSLKSLAEAKEDIDVLATSALFIALTGFGERVMLPEFGTNVWRSVFEPLDGQTMSAMESSIRKAFQKWDDRIEFVSFFATKNPDNSAVIRITFKPARDPLGENERTVDVNLPASLIGG